MVCVCVCVCVWKGESKSERERERESTTQIKNRSLIICNDIRPPNIIAIPGSNMLANTVTLKWKYVKYKY